MQGLHDFLSVPYYRTNFKFGRHIRRVHPNKSPLKILQKRSKRGRIQGLSNVLKYPLLSQERVKLYELQILYDRSEQKQIKIFGKSSRGCTQGLSKLFRAPIYRAPRAVIFAVAHLSCPSSDTRDYWSCIFRSSIFSAPVLFSITTMLT